MKKLRTRLAIAFDRSFSQSVLSQFRWLVCGVVIAFTLLMVLSLFAYDSNLDDDESRGLLVDTVMLMFDPGCMTSRMSNSYVIITALCGIVVFMGMFIPIVSNVLENRTNAVLNGTVSYKLYDHHIILGFNDSVPALVNFIRDLKKDNAYILVMSESKATDVRTSLSVALGQKAMRKIIILNGSRTSEHDLKRIYIQHAKSLWLIGEKEEEGHDSINFECAKMIAEIREKCFKTDSIEQAIQENKELSDEYWKVNAEERKAILCRKRDLYDSHLKQIQIDCHIMFEQPNIYSYFLSSDITSDIRNYLNFQPFNPYENWAKKVLVAGPEKDDGEKSYYAPLDDKGIDKDSDKHVHLIVIGMSRMGQTLAVEAAHIAHFPNFREDDANTRTHITFIDCNAQEEMHKFKSRFAGLFDLALTRYVDTQHVGNYQWIDPMKDPNSEYKHLGDNFIDIKWEFINGHSDSPEIKKYLIQSAADKRAITTIAVCVPDSHESMRIALGLPTQACTCHQILVYQDVYSSLMENFANDKRLGKPRQFGNMAEYYEKNKIGEVEGRWINYFYADNTMTPDSSMTLDNAAALLWKDSKVVDQWSSIYSANSLYTKLRIVGATRTIDPTDKSVHYNIKQIRQLFAVHMDELKTVEHNRWNVEKLLTGFRALTDTEHADFKAGKVEKNTLKKEKMAHLDICSNNLLKTDDPDTIKMDEAVNIAQIRIMKEKAGMK